MNIAGLSFRDLEYVIAVADHLHFGKAATACSVSQPTLSSQLRKLEDQLGIEVFERTGRAVLVTARGAAVIAQARVILNEGRRLQEIAHEGAEPLSGTYRLGVISTLSPYLTPVLLHAVRDRFPRLRLLLTEGLTHHLAQSLEAGELDAVLAAPPVRNAELTELPLFQEGLVLALPRAHRLARQNQIRAADLSLGDMILLNEGHCLRAQAMALFPDHRARRHRAEDCVQAPGLESLRQMVGAGLGYGLMPQLAAQLGTVLDEAVVYRQIEGAQPRRGISLFHRPSFGRIRDTRLLRDLIRDTMMSIGTVTLQGRSLGSG